MAERKPGTRRRPLDVNAGAVRLAAARAVGIHARSAVPALI